jgi:integrase
MKRPWTRKPYQTRSGAWRYEAGFRDHGGITRTRAFTSEKRRDAWIARYEEAERENRLKAFLEGVDPAPGTLTVEELLVAWFAHDADPALPGGLARATFDSFRSVARRHIIGITRDKHGKLTGRAPYAIGATPATDLESAGPIRRWLDGMRAASVGDATEKRAWAVLSSALSWAVERDDYPLRVNGCRLIDRRRTRRRSSRRIDNSTAALPRHQRSNLTAWALSPVAVELVRARLLTRPAALALVALRDATYVSVQYQLACRNQEAWALRWDVLRHDCVELTEVLSYDALDEGKTAGSVRRVPLPRLLADDLKVWRAALEQAGHATDPESFVFPGSVAGTDHGHALGHMTGNQARKWGAKYFRPAVQAVHNACPSEHPIATATPYSLRRGGISLRIRAGEDRQVIAEECGTSVAVIDRHYSFAIDALRHDGPMPADAERESARRAVFGTQDEADRASARAEHMTWPGGLVVDSHGQTAFIVNEEVGLLVRD